MTLLCAWLAAALCCFQDQEPLPKLAGPFAVGTFTCQWTDTARGETFTPRGNDHREVVVQFWYPADSSASGEPVDLFPHVDQFVETLGESANPRDKQLAKALEKLAGRKAHALPDAPLAAGEKKLPLVLFSPGGNVSRQMYVLQIEDLASRGYVVAAISSAYCGLDLFGKEVIAQSASWSPPKGADPAARDKHFEPLTDVLAADSKFVLDEIASGSNPALAKLNGRVDVERVGIIGHSRGGKTAARAATKDARIAAAVIYDNLPPAAERKAGFRCPVLLLRAGDWSEDDKAPLSGLFESARAPIYDAALIGAQHMTFTSVPSLLPASGKLDIDPARSHVLVCEVTATFLDAHLVKAGTKPLDKLCSDCPEIELAVVTPKTPAPK